MFYITFAFKTGNDFDFITQYPSINTIIYQTVMDSLLSPKYIIARYWAVSQTGLENQK